MSEQHTRSTLPNSPLPFSSRPIIYTRPILCKARITPDSVQDLINHQLTAEGKCDESETSNCSVGCTSCGGGRRPLGDSGFSECKASSGTDLLATSRVSDVVPVAYREGASQLVLDGDWDLAEAEGEIHSDQPDWAGLAWKPVKMPNTIQYALFEAGAAVNPWHGANWEKLQWIAERDWYLRRRFRIPKTGWPPRPAYF